MKYIQIELDKMPLIPAGEGNSKVHVQNHKPDHANQLKKAKLNEKLTHSGG